MNGGTITLSYRELAERLGISPDAARMKAKRAAETGRWRIIPGNHPSDRVSIEVPVADLNASKRVGGDEPEQLGGTSRTHDPAEDRTEARTPPDPVLPQMIALLQSAHDRLEQLNRRLSDEMLAQRQTAIALAGAETREAGLIKAVAHLEAREKALQNSLSAEKEAHQQTTIELVQAETREMSTSEDVYRLERHVERLEAHLRQERRPLWRRLMGRLPMSRSPQTSAITHGGQAPAAEKPSTRPLQTWEVADLI